MDSYNAQIDVAEPPSSAASELAAIIVDLIKDGTDPLDAAHLGRQGLKNLANHVEMIRTFLLSIFGDGADGDFTLAAGTNGMSAPKHYRDFTLSGGEFQTKGWPLIISGTLTWSGGKFTCNGANGLNGDHTTDTVAKGGMTGNRGPHLRGEGMSPPVGAAGQNSLFAPYFPRIHDPGTGPSGAGRGGHYTGAGFAGNPTSSFKDGTSWKRHPYVFGMLPTPRSLYENSLPTTLLPAPGRFSLAYGGGVGGGYGNAASSVLQGGGGGEGGGLVLIIARKVVISGSPSVECKGGNGGDGEAGGATGGGGGGAGGACMLITSAPVSGVLPTPVKDGGLGGAGQGGGQNGEMGSQGADAWYVHRIAA